MAIVAENIYFVVVVFALLPDRAGPGYSGLVYQSHKRLEVLGVRSLFAVLALAFLGTGIGRGIAIAGAIVLFFIWVGTGIKP
jgi:hypothetical protein